MLGLATTRPMAAGVESVPLVKLAPEAQFIGRGERKPIAQIEWTGARLEAEESAPNRTAASRARATAPPSCTRPRLRGRVAPDDARPSAV